MSELKKLGDFAVIGSGYAFSSDAFSEDGIPIIRMSDLCNGFVDIKHAARVSQTKGLDGFKLNQGDFLIGMSGSLDAYGVVGADVSTAYLNQRVGRLIIKDSKKAHYGFFAKVLSSDAYRKYVYREGIGAAQLNISSKQIECFEMFVPEYDIQKKIFQILDTIDTAIQQTQAIINKLKQLKQGLLHDLLTRGVGANGELRPCYEDAPHLYKESPLGWIPKEWEVKELAQLLGNDEPSMRSGPFGSALLKSELVEAGIPLLGIDNVHVEYFDNRFSRFVTAKKFYELARYAVRPNDLMITIMGTVGRCCLVPSDIGTALSSKHTWTITLNPNLYSPYLAMLQINYSPWALDHFSKGEQGGIMSAIRSDTLRTLILPTPPITEQKEIASRLLNISERISLEIVSVKKLQMKKTALMDDLLTGRVRVTSLLQPEASSA